MQKTTFEAGRYYIGDPCYVANDEQWDEIIKETGCFGYESFSSADENTFHLNGYRCWANGTPFGDGCYRDQSRHEYWVDAGLIGIVPAKAIENDTPDFRGGYMFHTFDNSFEVCYNDGIFQFGNITIDTN